MSLIVFAAVGLTLPAIIISYHWHIFSSSLQLTLIMAAWSYIFSLPLLKLLITSCLL